MIKCNKALSALDLLFLKYTKFLSGRKMAWLGKVYHTIQLAEYILKVERSCGPVFRLVVP